MQSAAPSSKLPNELENYCVIASQSGIAGHVAHDAAFRADGRLAGEFEVAAGETVLGIPAQPHKQTKRQWIAPQRLPDLIRKMRDLEAQIRDLQSKTA